MKMGAPLYIEYLKWEVSVPTTAQIEGFKNIYTYLLTPCSTFLLKKLTGSQLVKNFPAFMEPEYSLPHLQIPAICLYPEQDKSSPCPPKPLS